MKRLEKLIRELCPDGVATVPLSKVAHYAKSRIEASEVNEDTYVGVENLLQNKQGKTAANSIPTTGAVVAFYCGDILIGNIRPYLKKIWLADCDGGTNGDVLTIQIDEPQNLMPKFLYYVLSSNKFFNYDVQNSKGAKMPRGSKEAVIKYPVPVPPLEVQREIVRILDNFTELTARRKQYEYYRDKLLTFDIHEGTSEVTWRTLGDIGKVSMCKRIMKNETTSDGDVPFYKIGTFGGVANAYISKKTFDKYKSLYSYPQKGDILISAAGTVGRTVVFDGEPAYFQDSNIVWIDNDESLVLNRFLYYYYQLQPWQISEGGTIARLYNDNISKTKIPVPPLEKQERIISTLDRFDALCNDLTSGLPAEIAARQKQYEYYRDKLLSFKELGT